MRVAKELGVRGTAIYFTITEIEKRIWLSITSAGHPPMILIGSTGVRVFPEGPPAAGPTFGHPLDVPLAEMHVEMAPGDVLVAYTDGVSDCFDPVHPWIEIAGTAMRVKDRDAYHVAAEIMKAVEALSPIAEDDATVLVVTARLDC